MEENVEAGSVIDYDAEEHRFEQFWDGVTPNSASTAAVAIFVAVKNPEWARYWSGVLEQGSEKKDFVERMVLRALPIPLTEV